MIKRINRYLLTHYPLIWNTRITWVLSANIILHILFFLSGFASISSVDFTKFNGVWDVGGMSMFTFSILCSLLVLILWLIFYLRNNAFKIHYRIDRFYLLKEFLIILIIVFSSISFFNSYNEGIKLKIRTITSMAEFRKELNIANHALGYIPLDKNDYFILNNCESRNHPNRTYTYVEHTDTVVDGIYSQAPLIREALKRPDAFSYKNYCINQVRGNYDYSKWDSAEQITLVRNSWIDHHREDSIRQMLISFFEICKKYNIGYKLNEDVLVNNIFLNSQYNISLIVPSQEYSLLDESRRIRNEYYFLPFDLYQAFSFADEGLPNSSSFKEKRNVWTIIAYVSIFLTLIVLCYRRFSRKVFLIAFVGSLIWAILIGLIMAGTTEINTFQYICIFLCLAFLVVGLINLNSRKRKTIAGTALSWHICLLPFQILFLIQILENVYNTVKYNFETDIRIEMMQHEYPMLHWIHTHNIEIIITNIFLVLFYIGFLFNSWTKKWQSMAEE